MTENKTPIQPDAVEIIKDFFHIAEVPPVINGWNPKTAMKRLWLAEAHVSKLIEAARKQGNMMDMMAQEIAQLKRDAKMPHFEKQTKKTNTKTAKKGTKKNVKANSNRSNDADRGPTSDGIPDITPDPTAG